MEWEKVVTNGDSHYPEDRRVKYVSGEYEITKEGDGNWWLRYQKKPLGLGRSLSHAKRAAAHHAEGK